MLRGIDERTFSSARKIISLVEYEASRKTPRHKMLVRDEIISQALLRRLKFVAAFGELFAMF